MYEEHFGLKEQPFEMTPDPKFLFMTSSHCEALAGLTYAVIKRKGFVVLTGDAGTGKTTLLRQMSQNLPATLATAVISNTTLTSGELLESALIQFGLEVPGTKPRRLLTLQRFLLETRSEHREAVLVIDEAHRLSAELLEEVRLLSNFEEPEGKLLQIVLVGQNEMSDLLDRWELRQLKQRIALRLSVRPLSVHEVEQYIRYRWTRAGSTRPAPFTSEAIGRIATCSGGIPRVVNVICDNALIVAYSEGAQGITAAHLDGAIRDLNLTPANPDVERSGKPARSDAGREQARTNSGQQPEHNILVLPTLERCGRVEAPATRGWRWFRRKPDQVAETV